MKRAPLYSGRDRTTKPGAAASGTRPAGSASPKPRPGAADASTESPSPSARLPMRKRIAAFARKQQGPLLVLAGIAIAIAAMLAYQASQPGPHEWVQEDIDAAVLHTLETRTLPSKAAKAAELVREAVVRVTGYVDQKDIDESE